MSFRSDNTVGIAPELLAAIVEANQGSANPYGDDSWNARLQDTVSQVFAHQVEVFVVSTGTAANCLALASLCQPYGAIYCHELAHILTSESSGPEFFTGGARLLPLAGHEGKLSLAGLKQAHLQRRKDLHSVHPCALSLTQPTESGTLYQPEELRQLCDFAHQHQLLVHVDGTRFANAVAALGCHPADISWRAGVDVLCFGATKNGALAAEVVVFFRRELAENFAFLRKRAAHLLSKMRFAAAQFLAYLQDQRWIQFAAHANHMAALLRKNLQQFEQLKCLSPSEINLVFVNMPAVVYQFLEQDGYHLVCSPADDGRVIARFVTSLNTSVADIDGLLTVLKEAEKVACSKV